LRDPDKLVYLRQQDEGLVVGGYERSPRPFREVIPQRSNPTVQPFDAAHFEPLWRAAAVRVPSIESAGVSRGTNGIESFTPDGEFLLGPSPELSGFWAACGFCAHGVSGAGGVGKIMAEWIVEGKPSLDVSHMRLDRFGARANDPQFVERGAINVYRTYYDLREQPA
jgi:4-methylaminobutanoate oxidase (formaldehyde-forming)